MRIVIADRGRDEERAGALAQRVLEIETYRTLALLGLPESQRRSNPVFLCGFWIASLRSQ